MSLYNELMGRGFIKQITAEEEIIKNILDNDKISIYCGFDPTKDSLHVGHLMPIMLLSHLQRAGHRPLCVVGGATALIGDPSGKDSMREMLTQEDILLNMIGIKKQLSHFIAFGEEKALLLNNFDWLGRENYLNFIREIGPYFSVNRMLTAECFKMRMEKGLTFLEFNYMLLQAFDFYTLSKKYNCRMEVGGDDQWSNILAGIELTRRKDQVEVFGLTVPLLARSDGKKMGKTENGAVWLDPNMTSPYEYYQYWRNTTDDDVVRFMKLYTYLTLEEIAEYGKLQGAELNHAKEILAYETTKIVHGQEEADKARATAKSIFENQGAATDSAPTHDLPAVEVIGQTVVDICVKIAIFDSKGEARRMIQQGGLSVNDTKITDIGYQLNDADVKDGKIAMRKGKKNFYFINVK